MSNKKTLIALFLVNSNIRTAKRGIRLRCWGIRPVVRDIRLFIWVIRGRKWVTRPKNCIQKGAAIMCDSFFDYFLDFFDKRPSKNVAAPTARTVFVFLLNTCFVTSAIFCGRSAKRRMKYPYQSLPNGKYVQKL